MQIATTSEEITSSLAVGAGAATRLIHTLAPDAMVELLVSRTRVFYVRRRLTQSPVVRS